MSDGSGVCSREGCVNDAIPFDAQTRDPGSEWLKSRSAFGLCRKHHRELWSAMFPDATLKVVR